MYDTVTMKIDKVSADRHGIMSGGNWYNNKFKTVHPSINAGDTCSVVLKDGKFWNSVTSTAITTTTTSTGVPMSKVSAPATSGVVATKAAEFPIPMDSRQRSIIRQNSLGHAVQLMSDSGITSHIFEVTDEGKEMAAIAEGAISLARMLEAYSTGDIEAVQSDPEAMEALAQMIKDA